MSRSTDRQGLAVRRLALGVVVAAAVLVGAFVAGADWAVAVSAAWGAAALVVIASTWWRIGRMDPEQTRAHARAEDFSRPLADLVVVGASVASLIAIGYTLVEAGRHQGGEKALLILLAVVVVALSWATIHTLYTLRYGDLYYGDPVGGIDFNEDDQPDYLDFAYLAFTVGMTFQVSDTSLKTKRLRRTALRHALLSFLFGAVIVALAINSVASLLR
jgi:uncharacterized membrane protein